MTRQPIDLFEKEPLKGNSEVHLHTATTRRDAVQQKVPFARIRLLDAVASKIIEILEEAMHPNKSVYKNHMIRLVQKKDICSNMFSGANVMLNPCILHKIQPP